MLKLRLVYNIRRNGFKRRYRGCNISWLIHSLVRVLLIDLPEIKRKDVKFNRKNQFTMAWSCLIQKFRNCSRVNKPCECVCGVAYQLRVNEVVRKEIRKRWAFLFQGINLNERPDGVRIRSLLSKLNFKTVGCPSDYWNIHKTAGVDICESQLKSFSCLFIYFDGFSGKSMSNCFSLRNIGCRNIPA